MSGLDPHHHHQVEHSVFGPASQPAHAPVVEPGAQRNRCAKAEIFRFHLHVPATPLVHTFIPPCGRDSKSDGKAQEWGGWGYFTMFPVAINRSSNSSRGGTRSGSNFSTHYLMVRPNGADHQWKEDPSM